MTQPTHHRLLASGLLEGPVEPASVHAWPAWARAHLESCPACQAQLEAERCLRDAISQLSALERRLELRGPPSLAELGSSLALRRPPPAGSLVGRSAPMPRLQFRSGVSPLELVRTSRGVRAWHPEATELLVLAAGADHHPLLLRHLRERTPGVSLDIAYESVGGGRILGVASREDLDPDLWGAWMRDALDAGEIDDQVWGNRSDHVHLSLVTVPAPLRSSMLRLRADALPDATPKVSRLLGRAAEAGRRDDTVGAAALYRRALEHAFTANDATGQIKAAAGVAYALDGLGYGADGHQILRWVVETHALDRTWASWVCRRQGHNALQAMDVEAAERWLEESQALGGNEPGWIEMLHMAIAFARDDHQQVVDSAAVVVEEDVRPASVFLARRRAATALLKLGQPERAQEEREAAGAMPEELLELELEIALLEVIERQHRGEPVDWDAVIADLLPVIGTKDGAVLSTWDHRPLLLLAERARLDGAHRAAATLFRLRFLDCLRAPDPRHELLAVAAVDDGLLVLSPNGVPRVRHLGFTRAQFSALVARARDELRGEGRLDACRTLGAILFPDGHVTRAPLLVASDGLLVEAPIAAVAYAVSERGAPTATLRELVGMRRAPLAVPRDPLPGIASLADANADLPWAAQEVLQSEATLWLRGKHVIRDRLRLAEPVGLLHIGLHARREHGLPQLMFADGPLGPAEIAASPLPGAPVVLLAGCATGVVNAADGVERSLADAFLRAGASAVIATRWPVEDREMLPFVRALVEAWPFRDVPSQVAMACAQLRRQGHPARCWAAPVVY
jgi:hypothetical protein